MEYFVEHMRELNRRWKDLPRRALLVLLVFAIAMLMGVLLPYFAPFAIAAVLAWILVRPARRLENLAAHKRIPAKAADALVVLLFYGILAVILYLIGAKLVEQVPGMINSGPAKIREVSGFIEQWIQRGRNLVDEETFQKIESALATVTSDLSSWAGSKAAALAAGTFNAAMAMPRAVLFVVLMIMGTFYFIADRARLLAFAQRWTPDGALEKAQVMRRTVFRAALGQIRAAVIMSLLTSAELMIGFSIMRVQYGVALGFFIGIVDVLPIIGAGLFLIPMAIYGILAGNLTFGLGCAALYGIVVVLRQIVEPRVVSVQLGLHPLETMVSMYAGLRYMGVSGMILGPVMLLFLRALLATSDPPILEKRKKPWRNGKKKAASPEQTKERT